MFVSLATLAHSQLGLNIQEVSAAMLSGLSQIFLKVEFYNNEPILTSTLAAGIVQDTFAREAGEDEGGEEETTGGYFYRYFYCSGWKFFRFLGLEFLSQNTNPRMCIRNVRTYTYIHTYKLENGSHYKAS